MKETMLKLWRWFPFSKHFQLLLIRLFHDEFLVAVVGIIFNDRDKILLFKHSYRKQEWGLPAGYINAKEHPKESLEREVKEESGLTISVDQRSKIRTDRESARLEIVYVGTFIGGDFKPSEEVTEAGFFAFNELPLLKRGQLLLIKRGFEYRQRLKPGAFVIPTVS